MRMMIVDDDPLVRESTEIVFEDTEYEVLACAGAEHARVAAQRKMFDIAFVDLNLGDESGLDLIPDLLEASPWIKIVVVTGDGTIETAVKAVRLGAREYLRKPLDAEELRLSAERMAELRSLERRVEELEEGSEDPTSQVLLESRSSAMQRAIEMAFTVADSDAAVLITGESGTGKGVLARAIHRESDRSEGPFGVVNCPALRDELLQSELFGHVRGSFTGAVNDKVGKIAATDGGTLFLDEIGDIPTSIQPKVLRFLQDQEYERVGDPTSRTADVRIVAATNHELERAVKEGTFRSDLFYRLNVIPIHLPPLRERREDIPQLAAMFLEKFAFKFGRKVVEFTDAALRKLEGLDWPGNVRELENAVARAVILAPTRRIGANLIPGGSGDLLAGVGVEHDEDLVSLEEMESRYIEHVLESTESIERAAEVLDIAPSTLWRRRRKYGI